MRVTFCGHKEVYDAEAVEHWLRQVCSDQAQMNFYVVDMAALTICQLRCFVI